MITLTCTNFDANGDIHMTNGSGWSANVVIRNAGTLVATPSCTMLDLSTCRFTLPAAVTVG